MHKEFQYGDRIYLVWQGRSLGEIETVALLYKGNLSTLPDYKHNRDADAVQLFKEAYK